MRYLPLVVMIFSLCLTACTTQATTFPPTSIVSTTSLPTAPIFAISVTDGVLIVLDSATHHVVSTVQYPDLKAARQLALTPDGMLYITLNNVPGHVYDEILVIDTHTGTIVTRFKTANSPYYIYWVGDNTILVGHTSHEVGGYDTVLINTQSNSILNRFKTNYIVQGVVVIDQMVYFAHKTTLDRYNLTTHTLEASTPISSVSSELLIEDRQHVFVPAGGKEDIGKPCNVSGGQIGRLNLSTGKIEPLFPIQIIPAINGINFTKQQTLLALDTCFDVDHGQLTAFDAQTNHIRKQILVTRNNGLIKMSPVTPQGEIALFINDTVEWYDANTLELRGQTQLPIKGWVDSAITYPDETKVHK